MQLGPNLWIEGSYYVDFDELGQLRIVGPNNHLHFGAVGLYRDQMVIDSMHSSCGELVVVGRIKAKKAFFHDPAMGHIMKIRHYIELAFQPTPPFEDIMRKHPEELAANSLSSEFTGHNYEISYRRVYAHHWYGVRLSLAPDVTAHRHARKSGFNLVATKEPAIGFTLITDTDELPQSHLDQVVKPDRFQTSLLDDDKQAIDRLLDRTAIEITHLVRNNKTSGFEYGTVFPRDWMESADLGSQELEPKALAYMYHKAFQFVSPQGIGWHENVVGEFEFEKKRQVDDLSGDLDDLVDQSSRVGAVMKELVAQVQETYVIRNMVDIEPRYLLSLERVEARLFEPVDIQHLRRVARFLLGQAESNDLITFKKIPAILRRHKHDEYYSAGNWRDSDHAFKMVHPVIAPYDVNVVFYPAALKLMVKHAGLLGIDQPKAEAMVKKWAKVKDWYRFENADSIPAYALALYDIQPTGAGIQFKKLEVNHLDEGYEAFYGEPSETDVASFAKRLLSPDYFFTASGPILVGAHDGYDTKGYHGTVIWTKQTAYVVAGLYRQLERAHRLEWPKATQKLLYEAIIKTAEASISAFIKLGAVPELHYDLGGVPHLYNDQPDAEGPMNTVQLWSAVGARRIIRTYLELLAHAERFHH